MQIMQKYAQVFMRKWGSRALCFALILGFFSGCGKTTPADSGKLRIVTTIFPVYDWVRQILAEPTEDVELTMLLDNGVDLHSYQPTAEDMVKLSTCDLFIYVGGESDAWVEDALTEAINRDMVVVCLLDVLGDAVKVEELAEGMQKEDHEDEEAETEYDEHVWLSLKNAVVLCAYLAEKLGEIDPANQETYAANAAAYEEKLRALDARYAAAVDAAPLRTVLFGDRFPFRYLVDDYGLSYYAAFSGCSAETEASFETIVFLANKVDELGLSTVLTIEGSDGKIAQTILNSSGVDIAQILQMDSLQSKTARDVANGATYLGAMEYNLEVLWQALQPGV